VLLVPLGVLAWRRREEVPLWHGVAALAVAPLAVASFPVYLWIRFDNLHVWADSQREWGREFHPLGIWDAFARFGAQRALHPWHLRDMVFLIVYALLLALAPRAGVGWEWILAAGLLVLVPLTSGTVESVARFGLVGFAFYWTLAREVRRPWLEGALQAGCLALMVWWVLALPLANP
jgi:hypothetical protein